MVRQTSPVRSALESPSNPLQGVVQRLRSFTGTVMDLAGLQAQLVVADSQQAQGLIKAAALAALLAAVLLVTALPLLGLGVVELLVASGWDRAVALLAFGGLLAVFAAGLLAIAWRQSSRATASFSNSRREALSNLAWLRHAIDAQENQSQTEELGR